MESLQGEAADTSPEAESLLELLGATRDAQHRVFGAISEGDYNATVQE